MSITCSHCGYTENDNNANACDMCGEQLRGIAPACQQAAVQTMHTATSSAAGANGGAHPPNTDPPNNSQANQQPPQPSAQPANMLAGRVSRLSRSDEQPPKTVSEYLAKFLIGILIVVPYLALFFTSGIMAIALGILGFTTLAGLLNPFAWTTAFAELLEVLVLSRLRGGQNFPVHRGTVRIEGGTLRNFIMVGPFLDGDFTEGDDVQFNGSWRNGTFRVANCLNVTTNSTVVSQYRNRWPLVLRVVMFIYLSLGGYFLWLYYSGRVAQFIH